MQILPFKEDRLPEVFEIAYQYWKKDYTDFSESFTRTVSEFIVRKNFYNNNQAYMLLVDNKLRGILFGNSKNDANNSLEWIENKKATCSEEELKRINTLIEYLSTYDILLETYMTGSDAKVALFMSDIKGGGSKLLEFYTDTCKEKELHKLFLWTDTTCNHTYYPKRGFSELLSLDNSFTPSSNETFKTILYRKKL